MKYDIFMSYRHKGGIDKARILTQHLCSIGYNVFFDHEECRKVVGGFETMILGAIEVAPVFLFVLSPGCLDECGDEKNWVRREIEHAIKCKKRIIPIIVAEEEFDFNMLPSNAPESIKCLREEHHCAKVDFGANFKSTASDLIMKIKTVVEPSIVTAAATGRGAVIHFCSDISCRVFKYGKQIAITDPLNENDDSSVARLLKGRHKLEYKSIEHDADSYSEIYVVEDNDMEDFVEIKLQSIKDERLKKEEALRKQEERMAARERARARKKSNYKYNFFFIYSHKDALIVKLVKEHLESAGYTCLAETYNTVAWSEEMKDSQYVLYFHSENSRQSRFINAELEQAKEAGKKIKLIWLDESPSDYKTLSLIGNTSGIKLINREDIQYLIEALLDPNFRHDK